MKRPDLPVYYYHDHFLEMLSFVRTTYGPILTDEHDAFVLRFQTLSKDAQCLLIRMVNRRGAIFNRTFFRYAEISDVERAADDLLACGQARTLKAEDYASFVACLPKDILVAGAKADGHPRLLAESEAGRLLPDPRSVRGRRRALWGGEVHRAG
jgi:DNA polymerase-3 subunit epsilon